MSRILFACHLILLCACTLTPKQRAAVDRAAELQRDGTVIEQSPIKSEFQQLAAAAFEQSTADEPRHYLSLLNVGEDALLARIHLIRAARTSIDLQTFIWVDDDTGRFVFHELVNAARRGVKVRLLVDHFCKTDDPQILALAATAHQNLDLKIYNPIFDRKTKKPLDHLAAAAFNFKMLNQRMHNKVFIVDERIGMVGGRNIEDRYFDWDPFFNFKDRDIIVIGPAVADMHRSFDDYWDHKLSRNAIYLTDVAQVIRKSQDRSQIEAAKTANMSQFAEISSLADTYSLASQRPGMQIRATSRVEFVADAPEKTTRGGARGGLVTARINETLSNAQERVILQTPYMLLDNRSVRLFKKLRRERQEMELVFSTNSLAATDAFYVYAHSFKQRKQLVKRLKFQVHELKPIPADVGTMIPRYATLQELSKSMTYDPAQYKGFVPIDVQGPRLCIHCKTLVVDRRICYIGSHNFEPRSNTMNTESGVLIWDEDIARVVEENILLDAAPQNSWVLGERKGPPIVSNISEVVARISRALPFMDIWPFRYTSCYQLREGMSPVSPFDHEFRERYEDVGTFPEVNLSSEALSLRFIAAFGGWSKPLM